MTGETSVTQSGSRFQLPIAGFREDIKRLLSEHQVLIVAGETGSGKTTQIPQYCLEAGRGRQAMIGCTQPRRVAAVSVAERVAAELNEQVGESIGWQHRFSRRLSRRTRVKFMTDGILLAEIRTDPQLHRYDTIMLDEAHERTLQIDFLLGYLSNLLPRRRDLKVIVSSATLDVKKFSAFFGNAPILEVPGTLHPVEVRYRPSSDDEADLPSQVADAVLELQKELSGDILVFLPGEKDIRLSAETLQGMGLENTAILPFMANLPTSQIRQVFQPSAGQRRIILATNVAETSLTIPGISMVIDSGLARISRFLHRTHTQRLHIEPVSRASAEQRKGRCGRLGPGICIRLYAEDDFKRRPEHTEPEIRRSSLAGVILSMADMRLGRLEEYPLPDPPAPAMIREGYRELLELAALDQEGRITALGRRMARFPVAPRLARILLEAGKLNTMRDALIIVAALASEDPRMRPPDKQEEADKAYAGFKAEKSDFAGILQLWRWYHDSQTGKSRSAMRRLCISHFLSFRRMEEWIDLHEQLESDLRRQKIRTDTAQQGDEALHRALLSGMLDQIGMRDPEKNDYRGARGLRFQIHPGSGLFSKQPAWVVAAELVDTVRLYARRVAGIQPEWLEKAGAHICRRSWHSAFWDARHGTTRALEKVTLHGLTIVEGRRRDLSRIEPQLSREMFIRHGLVDGDLRGPVPPVVRANLKIFDHVRSISGKQRNKYAGEDEENFFAAYDSSLPDECVNLAALSNWLRRTGTAGNKKLTFRIDDFISAGESTFDFPEAVRIEDTLLRLRYRHLPGAEDDGISCIVPLGALGLVKHWCHDWLVPGALPGKIHWMLSCLPRTHTRSFISDQAAMERLIDSLGQPEGPLVEALCFSLRKLFNLRVSPGYWDEFETPAEHLVRFVIREPGGREAFSTRNPGELDEFEQELHDLGMEFKVELKGKAEQNVTNWKSGVLPQVRKVGNAGWPIINFPAWVDKESSVTLEWFSSRREALVRHRQGVLRLYRLIFAKSMPVPGGRGTKAFREACRAMEYDKISLWNDSLDSALAGVFLPPDEEMPFSAQEFNRRLEQRRTVFLQKVSSHFQTAGRVLEQTAALEQTLLESLLPEATVADMQVQLAWLVFPGFCRFTPPSRLQHFERYLEAIRMRLERSAANPARDLERLEIITPYQERWLQARQPSSCQTVSVTALEEYRWMLEEFRVSLFAQELRTPVPVSAQRLDSLWGSVLRSC